MASSLILQGDAVVDDAVVGARFYMVVVQDSDAAGLGAVVAAVPGDDLITDLVAAALHRIGEVDLIGCLVQVLFVPYGELVQSAVIAGAVDGHGDLFAFGDEISVTLQVQGVRQILCLGSQLHRCGDLHGEGGDDCFSLFQHDLLRLCGVRVSMIRETDTAVYSDGCRTISEKKVSDIKNRTETVNQTENALLLSVHQNFFTEGKYHGAQVFYAKTPGSQTLAEQLQANLALGLEPGNRRQCKKSDGVYLMEHIGCTGVLVECGFLSNYEEEQRLLQPEYQKKLAAVIAGTLSVWLSEEHPNEI